MDGARLNILESERIILREVPVVEVAEILAGNTVAGQAWAEGYPFDGTIGGAKLVMRMVDNDDRPGFGLYQVIDRETGQVVGDIGFHSAPDEAGSVEIGYGLVPDFRGRGIATEAARLLTRWTLDQPGMAEVRAETDEGHLPSHGVLVNTGFTFLGSDGETRRYSLPRDARPA
jgi:RimJ/RimL family protein N-acetyltransferase